MSKDQRVYLRDILERIDRIKQVIAAGETIFRESFMHQDSIIRSFEVIGEIVKRLEPALIAQQPQVRWTAYAGFRDILIHQYDKVILDLVWESAQNDIEPLQSAIQAMLETMTDDAE
jgi:uncharacterized protein with HEPN domain